MRIGGSGVTLDHFNAVRGAAPSGLDVPCVELDEAASNVRTARVHRQQWQHVEPPPCAQAQEPDGSLGRSVQGHGNLGLHSAQAL